MTKYCSRFFSRLRSLFSSKKELISEREPIGELDVFEVIYGPPPFYQKETATLYCIAGELEGQTFPVVDGAVIGRMADSEICLRTIDSAISRHHAEFHYQENGQWTISVLSKNGIKVQNKYITQPTALRNNDIITIGNHQFRFSKIND